MRNLFAAIFIVALGGSIATAQTATLHLNSAQDGQSVTAGTAINWTITVEVSTGDNAGLALISTDLVQDSANPEKLDLPPGIAGSIDSTMSQFSRPQGLSNPGEGAATTGYIGVQRGTSGQKDLRQIGGAQNTFGVAGQSIGIDVNVASGIGQSGPQTVLSGSFQAPATTGSYTLRLASSVANVLASVNAPPNFSPVIAATVDAVTDGAITFSVTPGVTTPGDMNCDELVNGNDVRAFVVALLDPAGYVTSYPSCNILNGDISNDNQVTIADISGFVNTLLAAN